MNRFRAVVMLVLVATSILLSGTAVYRTHDWPGLMLSIGTNLLSTALTYYLIDRLVGARERREGQELEKSQLKQMLVSRMSSSVNSVAVAAVEELRGFGWLYDGTLRGVDLLAANLQGANLSKADLRDANFSDANLQEANLILADLRGAQFQGANLRRAFLIEANLQGASLVSCNLQHADLRDANLQESTLLLADLRFARLPSANLGGANLGGALISGADLRGTSLQRAKVEDVLADETTTLPDGSKWAPSHGIATSPFASKDRSVK